MLAGCSAFVLLIVMSFDWFEPRYEGTLQQFSTARDAWESLMYIRIVLATTGTITVVVVALRIAGATRERLGRAFALVAALGTTSFLLIVWRILDSPDFGLLAALGIALGGWWARAGGSR